MPIAYQAPTGRAATVLIHGLGETPMNLAPVAFALRQQGHAVENLAYPSTLKPAQALADEHIVPVLSRFNEFDRLNFVTHSLGGVLLHYALQRHRPANLARVVMTGPGLHGSEALEVYRRSFAFRMLYGPAAYQSGTGPDGFTHDLPKSADYELGIISGCLSSDLLANTFIPWPHDGKISVARTHIEGMKDHIVLPLSHDFLSNDPLAVYQIVSFLRDGRFFHLADTPPAMAESADSLDQGFVDTGEFGSGSRAFERETRARALL